jgi:predicted PurR-regulated permease PerM
MSETAGLLGGLLIAAFVLWPVAKKLRRLGVHPAWLALVMIPLAALVLLWCLSYAKWPGNEQMTVIH